VIAFRTLPWEKHCWENQVTFGAGARSSRCLPGLVGHVNPGRIGPSYFAEIFDELVAIAHADHDPSSWHPC
jgi:hypothetical protein